MSAPVPVPVRRSVTSADAPVAATTSFPRDGVASSTRRSTPGLAAILAAAALQPLLGCGDGASDSDDTSPYPDVWEPADTATETGWEPTDGGVDAADDADDADDADAEPDVPLTLELERAWSFGEGEAPRVADCPYASPLTYDGVDGLEIVATAGDTIMGLSPETGAVLWSADVPEPTGHCAVIAATPVIVGHRLIVGYQLHPTSETTNGLDAATTGLGAGASRDAHWVAAIDLDARSVDADLAPVVLAASIPGNGGNVVFNPPTQFGRGDLKWGRGESDESLGRVYVTFGNVRDLQPWHGWAFEVDLDAWLAGGPESAITGTLVTTPETDCGTAGSSGSTQRICGGGIWSPSGPLVVDDEDGPTIVLPAGNGQLDFERGDYANSLLRARAGLAFDAACDAAACTDFDSDDPALECIESCENLFVPRLPEGQPIPDPGTGVCDGLALFECWQQLDYIGGSTPTYVEVAGHRALAYPTKDGSVYLVDYDHFGRLFDRLALVDICGSDDDTCRWFWAGMIVTQPEPVEVDGETRLLVPTFMPDRTHPAGVVSIAVVPSGDGLRLERRWEFPSFDTADAVTAFRTHPSRATVATIGGEPVAFVVEASVDGTGDLHVLRADTGESFGRAHLLHRGYRFTKPLVAGDLVVVNSCDSDNGPGGYEAYRIVRSGGEP